MTVDQGRFVYKAKIVLCLYILEKKPPALKKNNLLLWSDPPLHSLPDLNRIPASFRPHIPQSTLWTTVQSQAPRIATSEPITCPLRRVPRGISHTTTPASNIRQQHPAESRAQSASIR